MSAPARLGIAALAALVGAAIGGVTTFAHGALPPWVLIAGLAIVAAYVVGLRLAFDERMPAVAGALGAIAALAVVALLPVDLVMFDTRSVLAVVWLVGMPIVAALGVAWPVPRAAGGASGTE